MTIESMIEDGVQLDALRQAYREYPSGLRVWWVRNIPAPATYYPVADLTEALHVYGRLIWHDLERTDVESNVGGLEILREDGEWEDWDETDDFNPELFGRQWLDSFGDIFDGFCDSLRHDDD